MKLVLASKSARRKEILSMVTQSFEVRVSGADESVPPNMDLYKVPEYLAKIKAEATPFCDDEIVIGCDTVVIYEGKLLGKPRDKEDAIKMLKALSGTKHAVVSGLAILSKGKSHLASEVTYVTMRKLSCEEICAYVEKFNPVDKAGAYGIQEMAGAFVEKIEGDFYNVVGLPLCKLVKILQDEFDISLIK